MNNRRKKPFFNRALAGFLASLMIITTLGSDWNAMNFSYATEIESEGQTEDETITVSVDTSEEDSSVTEDTSLSEELLVAQRFDDLEDDEVYVLHFGDSSLEARHLGGAVDWNSAVTIPYGRGLSIGEFSSISNINPENTESLTKLLYCPYESITYENDDPDESIDLSNPEIKSITSNTILPVGNYAIFFDDGTNSSFGIKSEEEKRGGIVEYVLKVEQTELGKAGDLSFNTTTKGKVCAEWSPVTVDKYDREITESTKIQYKLKLYYADETEAFDEIEVEEGKFSVDLYTNIITSGKGYGNYYFEIVASEKLASKAKENYTESVSDKSVEYHYSDTVAPVISSFEVVEDENGVKSLKGIANDDGTGIAAYAFAAKESAEDISDDEWVTVTKDNVGEDYECLVDINDIDAGHIYFYVKDRDDNYACAKKTTDDSNQDIYITVIKSEDYYVDSAKTDYNKHLLNNESLVLPTGDEMKKIGFVFGGWYSDDECQGEAITEITPGLGGFTKGNETEIFAKWTAQEIKFAKDPEDVIRPYNGEEAELVAEIDSKVTYKSITWQWYRKADESAEAEAVGAPVLGVKSVTYKVKDVADSGIYYATASIVIADDEPTIDTDSKTATVNITNRKLNLKIKNETISYGEEAPAFTFEFGDNSADDAGLVGSDKDKSAEELFGGFADGIVTDYKKGDSVGDYTLTYDSDATSVEMVNYDVAILDGNLTVEQADLSAIDRSKIKVVLKRDEEAKDDDEIIYEYDGNDKEPKVVSVTLTTDDGDITLIEGASKDYTVSYWNNIDANQDDTAVVITFANNYKGEIRESFVITRTQYEVNTSVKGWKYGEYNSVENGPFIDTHKGGEVTYYYLETDDLETSDADMLVAFENLTDADKAMAVTERPVDAGRYYVWGVIEASGNYESIVAKPAIFTIAKRHIVLTTKSRSWPFDANVHTYAEYTVSGDDFVDGGAFQYVSVTGQIKEIGEVDNTCDYKLTSLTDPNGRNYEIEVVLGKLTITETKLEAPTTFRWSSTEAGTVEWVAITRDELDVSYEVNLYRTKLTETGEVLKENGNIVYEKVEGATKTVTGTSVSLLDDILADSAETQYGYTADIRVIPVYSGDAKHNYIESDLSSKLMPKYTVLVDTVIKDSEADKISDSKIDVADGVATSTVLLQGQSLSLRAYTYAGYKFDGISADFTYAGNDDGIVNFDYWKSTIIHFMDGTYEVRGIFDVTNGILTKPQKVTIYPKSSDQFPYTGDITAVQGERDESIDVNVTLHDYVGLDAYAFVKVASEDAIPSAAGASWTTIEPVNGVAQKDYRVQQNLKEAGIFYIAVRDTAGNVSYEGPVVIYSIQFDGNGADNAAEEPAPMATLYKLKDASILLPDNEYVKAGYGFTNWTGKTGIYANDGLYITNSSDTLKAGWTDKKVTYTVRYFYQKLTEVQDSEGNITDVTVDYEEATPVEFTSAYGATINYINKAIRSDKKGYTLTSTPEGIADYQSEIVATEDGQEICLYYNLNKYNITYTYTDIDGTTNKTHEVDEFYFGQTVTEAVKPSRIGYTFIGWNWGDAGQAPSTMPANSLNATGSFTAEHVKYYIEYYLQNLDQTNKATTYLGKSFGLDESREEVVTANFGESLNATITKPAEKSADATDVVARDIIGFTVRAVEIHYGNKVTKVDGDGFNFDEFIAGSNTDNDSDQGTVQKHFTEEELEQQGIDPEEYTNGPTYICFYYERNIYEITLDVYKDARESGKHLFGSYYDGTTKTTPDGDVDTTDDGARWSLPYGYKFALENSDAVGDNSDGKDYKASYFENFGYLPLGPSTTMEDGSVKEGDSVNWTKRWPSGEASKDKYYLAKFVDWSTGDNRPEYMPAGNAAVTREYATAEKAKFKIEIYYETIEGQETVSVTDDSGIARNVTLKTATGTYERVIAYERYADVGATVKIVDSMDGITAEEGVTYVEIPGLIGTLDYHEYYEHNPENDLCEAPSNPNYEANHEKLTGVVTENIIVDGAATNMMTLRVNLVRKQISNEVRFHADKKLFAKNIITQKWGTTYLVDQLYYFDGKTTAHAKGSITDSSLIKDFRNNKYVVSYYRKYYLKDDGHWEERKYHEPEHGEAVTAATNPKSLNAASVMTAYVGRYSSDYVNVYYSSQEVTKHYLIKLKYEYCTPDGDDWVQSGKTEYLVVSASNYPELEPYGSDFQLYVANACDIYDMSTGEGTDLGDKYSRYPGAYYLLENGDFKYNYKPVEGVNSLKAGFEAIEITYTRGTTETSPGTTVKGTFFVYNKGTAEEPNYAKDGSGNVMLFAADTTNQFYNGNQLSFNYNSKFPAHIGRDVFNEHRPTYGRVVEVNNSTSEIYINGIVPVTIDTLPTYDFTAYYYDVYNDFYLEFIYDGKHCTGCRHHDYAYKQNLTMEDIKCNTFSCEEGSHIVWYFDEEYTRKVEPFTITGRTYIYGRKEKDPIQNNEYAFYKLPEEYSALGNKLWVSISDLAVWSFVDRTEAGEITGSGFEKLEKDIEVEYINEFKEKSSYSGVKTEWYYDGLLLASLTPAYSMTYQEFSMDYTKFVVPGYEYDDTDTRNKSKAYVSTTPVNMYAYFKCKDYALTVRKNNSKISNDEIINHSYGETVSLTDPEKEGYTFNKWILKDADNNLILDENDYRYTHIPPTLDGDGNVITPGETTFRMPNCNTIAAAVFDPAEIEFVVTHLLQDDTKTYNIALLETAKSILAGEVGNVTDNVLVYIEGNETPVSAKVLSIGDAVKAVAYTDSDERTYFFNNMTSGGGKTTTDLAHLFAVEELLSGAKSEDEIAIDDKILDGLGDIFDYTFTTYSHDTTQLVLGTGDSFEAYCDANVVFYYTRSSSIVIRTLAFAVENITDETLPSGLTLAGAGDHYYGETVDLYATMQPNGYTFLGWFKAEDVLEDYEILSNGSLPDSLAGYKLKAGIVNDEGNLNVTPESVESTYSIVVKQSADYVALTSAGNPAKPTINVKSNRILTDEEAAAVGGGAVANPYYYGYDQDGSNSFTASIVWGEEGQGANSVGGYKWYYKYYAPGEDIPDDIEEDIDTSDMTPVPNSNSGTTLFATGKSAGTYVYRCVVDVVRSDNNRKSQVYGSYKFDVLANESYYHTSSNSFMYSVSSSDQHKAQSHTYIESKNYATGDSHPDIKYYYSKEPISKDISEDDLAARLALPETDDNKIYDHNIAVSDVLVDETTEDKTVIPHVIYYFVDSNDANYADLEGSENITITPAPVTVVAKAPFVKYYDKSAMVNGASFGSDDVTRRWVGNHQTYSDFKRLQLGSMVNGLETELKLPGAANEADHYQIRGILACDADLKVVLNFTASYDYEGHVGATCVTLSDLWVAQTDLYEVTNNYNYRFVGQENLELSGQIKPYPLEVEWKPYDESEDRTDYSFEKHDYDYNYNGLEQKPVVIITDEHTPDPKGDFNIVVRNGQKNVGEYLATAEVLESENHAAHYKPSDYSFSLTGQKYRILARYILALPKDVTKIYNGKPQTQLKNDTVNEFRFFTKEKATDSWVEYAKLPDGEDFTVQTDRTRTNVGTEHVKVTKLTILDKTSGIIINDNYHISFTDKAHPYGVLTIAPCPVVVASGITASDKNYDGNRNAEITTTGAVFARIETDYDGNPVIEDSKPKLIPGLYGSDALSISATAINGATGAFDTAKAGIDKTVNITYDNSGADATLGFGGALKGKSAGNYRLVTEYSQDKTTATIFSNTQVTISIDNLSMTYGESLSLSDFTSKLTYSGFIAPDNESEITGYDDARFVIKKKNGASYEEVAADGTDASVLSKLDAGTYYIFFKEKTGGVAHEVDGLTSEDYTVVWDNTPATLTISRRPVKIVAKAVTGDDVIHKVYDGNTTVEENVVKQSDESGYKYYEFTDVEGYDISGRVNDDDISINTYSAQYDSAKASMYTDGAKLVNVTSITLGGKKAGNYLLTNNAIDINARIDAISLTIRVKNATTIYGNAAPTFTYEITGALEEEKDAILAAVTAGTTLDCDYDTQATGADIANRNAGKYKITVDAENRYTNKNYNIVWEDGDTAETNDSDEYGYLTVEKRKVYFKAKDASINYGKENPPSIFEGQFLADSETDALSDGFVYGENVNTLKTETSDFLVAEGSIPLYTDSGCVTPIVSKYALDFTCYENKSVSPLVSVNSKTPFGEYDIDPANVEGFVFADNYEFINVEGKLDIKKYYMVVENVKVLGKIYDATTEVTDSHILREKKDVSGYQYPGLKFTYYEDAIGNVDKFVEDEKFLNSLDIKCEYESADVSDESVVKVSITIIPGSYLDDRYVLVTADNHEAAAESGSIFEDADKITQTSTIAFIIGIGGSILRRPITFYPTDRTILYGESIDIALSGETKNISVVKDVTGTDIGFAGTGAKKETFSTIGFTLGKKVYSTTRDGEGNLLPYVDDATNPAYVPGSDVGIYALDISSSTVDYIKARNYESPEYKLGLLTVVQNKLAAPTVTWDATTPGRINWTKVNKIGNVDVDHYELELFNDGVKVGETVVTSDNKTLTTDAFISVIHSQPAGGKYTVKVKAIASSDNNDEYKNVEREGREGVTAAPKYAAKVTVVFDTDADTTEATTDASSTSATINGGSSYIMIAGENAIDVAYTWGRLNPVDGKVYKTGYKVKEIKATSDMISFGAGSGDSVALTGEYQNALSLNGALASAGDITVTLTLLAREAGITKTVITETHDPIRNVLMFTYTEAENAELEANAEHGIYSTESGYTYEYNWYVRKGADTVDLGTSTVDAKRFIFPLGQTFYKSPYLVCCTIRAIRNDNGKEATKGGSTGITVIKFKPDSAKAVSISAEGWEYGTSREDKITFSKRVEGIGDPTKDHLEYRVKGSGESGWTSELPTDVGVYEAKAVIAANENYDGVDSLPAEFEITPARLGVPTGVDMLPSTTAPYGHVIWEAVDGPVENAGAADSKSHINVKYSLTLSYIPTGDTVSRIVTTVETTACEYDFTDKITHPGEYSVTVTAKVDPRSDESPKGQDKKNCLDGEPAAAESLITIGASITSDTGAFSKVYDGKKLTMTVDYAAGHLVPAYQWMKNGKAIDGATEATYSVVYVNESANYSCRVVPDEQHPEANIVYTKIVKVTVSKRPITVVTASDRKTYDGEPLTNSNYELKYYGDATKNALGIDDLGVADTSECTVYGTATFVKDTVAANNKYKDLIIKHGNLVVYSNDGGADNCYEIRSSSLGTLTIDKREIHIEANSYEWTYDGLRHSYNDDLGGEVIPSTDVGYVIKDTDADKGLAGSDEITSITFTGAIKDITAANKRADKCGEVANIPSAVKISNATTDVTANYTIRLTNGALVLKPMPTMIVINHSELLNKVYDKKAVVNPVLGNDPVQDDKASYTKTGDGTVRFEYYTKSGNEYTKLSGNPINAGTYYVKAFTAATNNYAAAESDYYEFVISKRAITIKADNKSGIYGDNIKALTYEVRLTDGSAGTAIIDAADKTALNIAISTTAVKASAAGLYPIEVTYTDNNNYDVTLEHCVKTDTPGAEATFGKYEIAEAQLKVTSSGKEVVYDGAEYGITVTAAATTTTDVKGTPIIYYSDTPLSAENYTSGRTEPLKYSDVKLEGDNVVAYTVYYYVACDNFVSQSGSQTVLIKKRPVTFTADSATFVYDGQTHTWEETTTHATHYGVTATTTGRGIASTDSIDSVVISGSITDYGEVATVITDAVIKNKTTGDAKTFNYDITYINGKLNVTKATDSITNVSDLSKVYDGTPVGTPTFTHDDKNTGTVSYKYYSKTGATYTELTEAPKTVGTWYVRIEIDGDPNYTKTVGAYVPFKISKKALTITSGDGTKVYDGKPLTEWSNTPDGLEAADAVASIEYTGTITNVKYSGDTVTYVDNTFRNVVIKDSDGNDVTNCYEITPVIGKLTVTPKNIETLELEPNESGVTVLTYTGSKVSLSEVNVYSTLGSDTQPTKLNVNTDYSITDDPTTGKVTGAIAVGTYTVEVVGKGNYTGTLTKTYRIEDKAAPEVTGKIKLKNQDEPATDGGKYCGGVEITISDPNLTHVSITIAGGDASDTVDEDVNVTTKTYTLKGSSTETPSVYTVVATDISGNVNESYVVSVWANHNFCVYSQDMAMSSTGEVYKVECEHEGYRCGAYEHVIRPKGTVHWDYEYDYPTSAGVQHGIVDISQRETHAKVEVIYNGNVIATKYVDCVSICKDPGSATNALINYVFDNYDESDSTKDSGSTDFPYIDEDGTEHKDYEIKVTPVIAEEDGTYTTFDSYFVTHLQQYLIGGDEAYISYNPNCFDVPWRVEVSGLPTVNGEVLTPSAIFVKVLYAETEDADDEHYYPITQLAGGFMHGVKCHISEVLEDGTVVYEGSYPCWQFIGGSNDSYYHRIQIVGYELEHNEYDVTGKNLRSICDDDHINHTIFYMPEPDDKASGTILYQLRNLIPSLVLDKNTLGNADDTFATLWAGINEQGEGGKVTYAEINKAGRPSRKGYSFVGWYTERVGGKPIRGDVDLKDGNVTLYAHWSRIEPENPDDDPVPNPTGEPGSPSDSPVTPPAKPEQPGPDNPTAGPTGPVLPPGVPVINPTGPVTGVTPEVTPEVTKAPEENPVPDEDDNGGRLIVVVENGDGDNPDAGPKDKNDKITGDLPDKEDVADKVVTEEEKKIVDDGGEIIVRLKVTDDDKKKDKDKDEPLKRVIDKLKKENPDKPKIKFETYIDLKLEKKINGGEWQRILESGGEIEVRIDIPEKLRGKGKQFAIARLDGDEYVILKDIDNDPNSITIMTGDFDTDYVLISIGENAIPLIGNIHDCFWHWIILLMLILSGATAIIWWKKDDDEDEEEEKPKTSDDDEEDKRRIRRKGHWILVIVFNGIGAICVILGSCGLDIIFEIASILIAAVIEIVKGYRNREDKEDEEKRQNIK